MSENTAAAEFAAQLRILKERSGLSYGVLAKRLHMSTSTLHRYCNGDAVPTEYAPVERLARLCKARPEELVELHRKWVLADVTRGRKGAPSQGAASAGGAASVDAPAPAGGPVPAGEPARVGEPAEDAAVRDQEADGGPVAGQPTVGQPTAGQPEAGVSEAETPGAGATGAGTPGAEIPEAGTPGAETPEAGATGAGAPGAGIPEAEIPAVTGPGEVRVRPRRRTRTAVLAGIAVAAVLGGVTFALGGLPGDGGGGDRKGPVGAAADGVTDKDEDVTASPSASASASSSPSSSASPSPSAKGEKEAPRTPATASTAPADDGAGDVVPLTVRTEPYLWKSPCAQRYLVNRPASGVKPPPTEQDATAWVSSFGAVSSEEQYVRLTVQGAGDETVVVEELNVRVAGKRSPLAWNDFVMGYPGVGCGAGVPTRSFTVALDAARPVVTPESGQRDFPFSVSESDPEVYYITADASAYDVSWYLELKWSSGSRSGTLTVDDKGRPFRTSGNNGRPAYEFPLGGEEWVPEGTTNLG
ncbi:helix-turn-helix domain-containing protein [Streptomyces sp. CB02400]|uniref:helix-turn-helix domain-containing protein n=1 Tax=Streptomyces sp. CB02400 TaxID=1703944 RepID=UPI00093B9E8D|nr:helix-turn-helix transcriptional regulator [Streptomyces sp. CB02400]OKK11046.1 DNA-binding protein [Streptomyces sp. CB02400]